MSGGRRTYTNADELYGKAKPSIPNTIANTPSTADPNNPVKIQEQTMEQRRNNYQVRNQTEMNRNGADNDMRRQGINVPARPMAPAVGAPSPARGFTGISAAPRTDDPDILKKDDAAYAAYQAGFGGSSDEEFKNLKGAQQKIYDDASSMDKARLVGNTLRRSGRQLEEARASESAANSPKVGDVRELPNGGRATVTNVRPAEGMGRPYAPPGAPMDQKRRKPIGRR
jgi:hypothetical protein